MKRGRPRVQFVKSSETIEKGHVKYVKTYVKRNMDYWNSKKEKKK
jgi:hypothetical protein